MLIILIWFVLTKTIVNIYKIVIFSFENFQSFTLLLSIVRLNKLYDVGSFLHQYLLRLGCYSPEENGQFYAGHGKFGNLN